MRTLNLTLAGSVAGLLTLTGRLAAQEPTVTPLMEKALTDLSGKEVVMITVEYAPGGADPVHRHNANAFVYVLEGSIVMQVKGGTQVTLNPGQTFYEGPDDIHVVTERKQHQTRQVSGLSVEEQGRPGGRAGAMRRVA